MVPVPEVLTYVIQFKPQSRWLLVLCQELTKLFRNQKWYISPDEWTLVEVWYLRREMSTTHFYAIEVFKYTMNWKATLC